MREVDEIILLEEVYDDIKKGILFYRSQEAWVADYFYNSIIADIDSLRLYAGVHRVVNNYYRMLCRHFPFAIYYNIEDNILIVYAVLDVRSNPQKNFNLLHKRT